jgi:CRP-like cAMP-binding protein
VESDVFTKIRAYYKNLVPKISTEALAELETCFVVKHYKKGDFLVRSGQIEDHVHFVEKGLLRIYQMEDGREVIGSFFPENTYGSAYDSFLMRSPGNDFIEVLEESTVIDLHHNDVQRLYDKYPELERFGRKIAEYLFIGLSMHIYKLQNLTAEERYRDFLDIYPNLAQRVPQYMIASFIGVTPEALSRIRKRTVL